MAGNNPQFTSPPNNQNFASPNNNNNKSPGPSNANQSPIGLPDVATKSEASPEQQGKKQDEALDQDDIQVNI